MYYKAPQTELRSWCPASNNSQYGVFPHFDHTKSVALSIKKEGNYLGNQASESNTAEALLPWSNVALLLLLQVNPGRFHIFDPFYRNPDVQTLHAREDISDRIYIGKVQDKVVNRRQ